MTIGDIQLTFKFNSVSQSVKLLLLNDSAMIIAVDLFNETGRNM